jgi:hypothetical protein
MKIVRVIFIMADSQLAHSAVVFPPDQRIDETLGGMLFEKDTTAWAVRSRASFIGVSDVSTRRSGIALDDQRRELLCKMGMRVASLSRSSLTVRLRVINGVSVAPTGKAAPTTTSSRRHMSGSFSE